MSILQMSSVKDKLKTLDETLELCLRGQKFEIPESPSRDVEIRLNCLMPKKAGLSSVEGRARLMHDLASIELQAMELGVRTLIEFPEAPQQFREELAEITRGEARHLQLCLKSLDEMQLPWGSFPTNCSLWDATHKNDSFLDRILIVHRYLEGSGLDAGEGILRKFNGLDAPLTRSVVNTILTEEVGHVYFGSKWYRQICAQEKIDSDHDFPWRMTKLERQIPKRIEKIARELRLQAGFTESEIEFLEKLRDSKKTRPSLKSATDLQANCRV